MESFFSAPFFIQLLAKAGPQDNPIVELIASDAPICADIDPAKYLGVGLQEHLLEAVRERYEKHRFKRLEEPFLAPLYVARLPAKERLGEFGELLANIRGDRCLLLDKLQKKDIEREPSCNLLRLMREHDFVLEHKESQPLDNGAGFLFLVFKKCLYNRSL